MSFRDAQHPMRMFGLEMVTSGRPLLSGCKGKQEKLPTSYFDDFNKGTLN